MVEPLADYYFEQFRGWADRYISRPFRTRMAFGVSVCALVIACFLAFQDEYDAAVAALAAKHKIEGELAEARQTGSAEQKREIDSLKKDLAETQQQLAAIAHPPRNPNLLYEGNTPVAQTPAPQINTEKNFIFFQIVTSPSEIDWNKKFSYRQWENLQCSGSPGSSLSFGMMREFNYMNVICRF